MDSKRQSKLPDGLGKKIIQALKTQHDGPEDIMPKTVNNDFGEPVFMNQKAQPTMEEHGLETISHMDFGTQEMELDHQSLDSNFAENQYGNFMNNSTDNYAQPEFGNSSLLDDPFLPQAKANGAFEQPASQDSYDNFSYNQQSYDDFDFAQESYEEVNTGLESEEELQEEEIPSFQQPLLGEPPSKPTTPSLDYSLDYSSEEHEPNDFEQFAHLSEDTEEEFDFSASNQSYQEHYADTEPQIGYSSADIMAGEASGQEAQSWHEPAPQASRGLDLDAVTVPQVAQNQPQDFSKNSLDLDQVATPYSSEPKIPETQKMQEPYFNEVHQQYQGPAAMEDKYYQQPPQEMYREEERYYQEPNRDIYQQQPSDNYYQQTPQEMYRPEEKHYQEPARNMYQQQSYNNYYQEPQREMYRSDERFYQDSARDQGNYRQPMDLQRRPEAPIASGERYSSNIETIIRLVTNLPNGVPKQTGAQIIRQTMEAMGISISDVIGEAQQTQTRMLTNTKENYTAIEEHKIQIRRLEENIYMHQRKAKELDDIINLFIGPDQARRLR